MSTPTGSSAVPSSEATVLAAGRPVHRLRTSCRCCGGSDLTRFLKLGPTPLANSFLDSPNQPEERYPLDLYYCADCSLVQLLDVIDPEVLFRDYIYVSGTSPTMREHFQRYAAEVAEYLALQPGELSMEAASNDGTLLAVFQQDHQSRVLGIEPARNIAAIARARGVDTVEEFFSLETARKVKAGHGAARALMGNNVLAHVDDPVGFLQGGAEIISEDGAVVIEVPYLGHLLERVEYDTVYHEHLSYFSVTALARMFELAGMRLARIDRVDVHGGSIRLYGKKESVQPRHADGVLAWIAQEKRSGMTSLECYRTLAVQVQENRRAIRALLEQLQADGKTVAAYGAPAKGNTLLNYCNLDRQLVAFTVDRSPHKVGKYTPGSHLEVLPVGALLERQPDYVLMLAWNFAEEILKQQAEYRSRGGKFILPVPTPEVI